MEEIDYSSYTIGQLRSTLSGIDRETYPEKVRDLEAYLEDRLNDPDMVLAETAKTDFFSSHVPSEIVTSIWLRSLGWSFLAAIVINLPIVFVVSLILASFGYDAAAIGTLSGLLNIIIYLISSWLILRKVVGSHLDNYELMFVRKKINKTRNEMDGSVEPPIR
jgi:hypothetical protein